MTRESLLVLALSICGPAPAQVLLPGFPAAASEVRARLSVTAASPQSLTLLLHASPDARLDEQGSYYALRLSAPAAENGGVNARLSLIARSGGSVTVLGETLALWAGQDADIRFVYTADSRLLAYINGQMYFSVRDTSVPAGQAGYANELGDVTEPRPLGSGPEVTVGFDDAAPAAFAARSIAYVDRVDLHWEESSDGAGSGLWTYEVHRDGVLIGRTDSTWYSDGSAPPGARHVYAVYAVDYFGNRSAAATTSADSPRVGSAPKAQDMRVVAADTSEVSAGIGAVSTGYASGITDGRRVGIRATGSYWGAGGEQIDTLSGNLNYTFPLLKAVGRGSWSVTFGLSYNSQIWLKDALGTRPVFNQDVGYGLGWRLMAGSLTPKWDGGALAYYEFRDSTGAEYRLDQYSGGVWTSREGIYVEYVESTQRLYFPDGSFWKFDCVTGGTEPDAGTRYPTLMQDTNGNQVFARYHPAIGTSTPNTSARLNQIEDVRAKGGNTYTFTYNTDAIPHLRYINQIVGGTVVMYQIDYVTGYNLVSPFDGTPYGTTTVVNAVCDRRTMLTHWIGYDLNGSGELTSVAMPYSGMVRWDYRTFAFSGAATIREVAYRYVRSTTVPGPEDVYTFGRDDTYSPSHNWTVLTDPTGAAKVWAFYVDPAAWYHGLLGWYEDRRQPWDASGARHQDMAWVQDAAGTPYIAAVNTYLDYGLASQVVSRTEQTLDTHGNVLQTKQFDYGNLSTPVRTYTHTYLTGTNYSSRHIWNRLVSTTLTDGTNTLTLVTNTYDQGSITNRTGLYEHDTANYPYWFAYRGNVTQRTTPGKVTNITYDIGGSVVSANDGQGHTVAYTQDSTTNYSAPTVITPNSTPDLATSYAYNAWIAPTSVTAPVVGTSTVTYDTAGRPFQTTSVFGGNTTYYYGYYSPNELTSISVPTTRTTVDGLGRPVRVTQGTQTQVYTVVDTEYAPCACSPFGKVKRVSQPYAPGGTPIWTTYNYDAFGRTTSIDPAGGGGATTYAYEANTVTVTDAAGKWKKYRSDALGNLVQVTEPAPEGGMHETYYAYNMLGQLTQVTMPRGAATQNRTFNYDIQTGRLLSATNPENGTVSYTYNADGTIATKTDAKGQRTEFTYDQHQRVSQVRYYAPTGGERSCERVNYGYSTNGEWLSTSSGGSSCSPGTLNQYWQFGRGGRMVLAGVALTDPDGTSRWMEASFQYSSSGHLSRVHYPIKRRRHPDAPEGSYGTDDRLIYSFDAMGRPVRATHELGTDFIGEPAADWIKDATYGPAGNLTSLKYVAKRQQVPFSEPPEFTYNWYTETRSYNERMQLTRLTAQPDTTLPAVDVEYRYSPTQNDGRITQMKDWVTGEEITYQYDSLNRLISAATTGPEWGLSFQYDAFGNLTNQTVTKGTGPSLAVAVDPATNRILGSGFEYDANGNLIASPAAYTPFHYSYDTANRLVTDGQYSTTENKYRYDPYNRKVWACKANSMGCFLYLYGPDGLLAEFKIKTGDPDLRFDGTEYVYFGGRQVMKISWEGDPTAVVTDRLGSARVANGTASSYFPYGETRTGTGPMFATYPEKSLFTNLRYAMNRWYSSQIGRFTTPDPYRASASLANPQSWNRYAYVENDPVNRNDPSGLDPVYGITVWFDPRSLEERIMSSIYATAFVSQMQSWNPGATHMAAALANVKVGGSAMSTWVSGRGRYNNAYRAALVEAIRTLSPNCRNAFDAAKIDREALSASAVKLQFWETQDSAGNARFEGRLYVGSIVPGSINSLQTLADTEYLGNGVRAEAVVLPDKVGDPTPNVVLHRGFMQSNPVSQGLTLIHEALHVFLGVGDIDLANMFGLKAASVEQASAAFGAFLVQDCIP